MGNLFCASDALLTFGEDLEYAFFTLETGWSRRRSFALQRIVTPELFLCHGDSRDASAQCPGKTGGYAGM